MKEFNLLKGLRTTYVNVLKMIPLHDKIMHSLFHPFTLNNILSMGRVTRLASRVKLTHLFVSFILKYNKNHGAVATVKWLKAALVSLQKELGQDRVTTLVLLGTINAYSKLSGGLPRIIPAKNRAAIRRGDIKEIRFWTGLFNLYRILECAGSLKSETITNPFSGNQEKLEEYISAIKDKSMFALLPGFKRIQGMSLKPTSFVKTKAASPSNKQSFHGIVTDVHNVYSYQPQIWGAIINYLVVVDSSTNGPSFLSAIVKIQEFGNWLLSVGGKTFEGKSGKWYQFAYNPFSVKPALQAHGYVPSSGQGLSQFAIKNEAAGKIRLFAMADSLTQSVMKPLHDMLFALLKQIPNDGTFDQDASIRRAQAKAKISNCAYSFDLTAATDRLPAILTSHIMESISGKPIARWWLQLMTDRNFWFNEKLAKDLKVIAGPYRYAVGQPMGAYSSWAGLAVTHHWVVQQAAFQVTNDDQWNLNYEILGDDLVIFDRQIADKYLQIMTDLGCEINLYKSIVSHNRPVFEFAKRTCWGDSIVSGISFAQIRSGWNVAGRVNNALHFINNGLIPSKSILTMVLSRNCFHNGKSAASLAWGKTHTVTTARTLSLGILALFGNLHHKGVISLKTLVQALIKPSNSGKFDFGKDPIGIPIQALLNEVFTVMVQRKDSQITFSKSSIRDAIYSRWSPLIATATTHSILHSLILLATNYYSDWKSSYISNMINLPYSDSGNKLDKLKLGDTMYPNLGYEFAEKVSEIADMILEIDRWDKVPSLISKVEDFYSMNSIDQLWTIDSELDIKNPQEVRKMYIPRESFYSEADTLRKEVDLQLYSLKPVEEVEVSKIIFETAPALKVLKRIANHQYSKRTWLRAIAKVRTLL